MLQIVDVHVATLIGWGGSILKNHYEHGITFAQYIINCWNTLSDLMLQIVDVHVATLIGWGEAYNFI